MHVASGAIVATPAPVKSKYTFARNPFKVVGARQNPFQRSIYHIYGLYTCTHFKFSYIALVMHVLVTVYCTFAKQCSRITMMYIFIFFA